MNPLNDQILSVRSQPRPRVLSQTLDKGEQNTHLLGFTQPKHKTVPLA
jgi:hypothetical protein